MKRIVLTILYPVWFFLAKTWLGNMMMIPIVIGLPMLPFYNILNRTGEDAESIGIGFAVLDMFLLAPITAGVLMSLSFYMEEWYEENNWKIEINNN